MKRQHLFEMCAEQGKLWKKIERGHRVQFYIIKFKNTVYEKFLINSKVSKGEENILCMYVRNPYISFMLQKCSLVK